MTTSNKIDVLDKGYVRLRDHMGDDLMVVNSARVSFDKASTWLNLQESSHDDPEFVLRQRDRGLLNFLAREGHWSPFSHPQVSLEIKAPWMVVNQIRKHAVGSKFSYEENMADPWNEMSGRYVSEDLEFYTPHLWRSAPDNRKQGSGDLLDDPTCQILTGGMRELVRHGLTAYNSAIDEFNVAPEQARIFLPYAALYTKLMWGMSLYRVMTMLHLREDEHTQWETTQYANAIRELVQPLFPESFAAFEESNRKEK